MSKTFTPCLLESSKGRKNIWLPSDFVKDKKEIILDGDLFKISLRGPALPFMDMIEQTNNFRLSSEV